MSRTVVFLVGMLVTANAYNVPATPNKVGQPFDGFVSYSMEFASFPEFAGNTLSPNQFSYNLLKSLGDVMGTNPYIRVGGNTQYYALFNGSQKEALSGTVDPTRSPDYPTTITIGPAFFESYNTWPGFQYSHGLNLGLGGNRSAGWQTLVEMVPLACKTLARILVINMHGYNTTVDGAGLEPLPNPATRETRTYSFHVESQVPDGQLIRI